MVICIIFYVEAMLQDESSCLWISFPSTSSYTLSAARPHYDSTFLPGAVDLAPSYASNSLHPSNRTPVTLENSLSLTTTPFMTSIPTLPATSDRPAALPTETKDNKTETTRLPFGQNYA